MRLVSYIFVGIMAIILAACSPSQQQSLQTSIDRNALVYTIGKQYAQIAKSQKTTQEGLFGKDPAYGNLVSTQTLSGGDIVYKHVDPIAAARTSMGIGFVGNTSTRIDYRLLYFRVGADGIIKDYANGAVTGGEVSCVDWIGGLIQNCGNQQQLAKDIAQMDLVVRTSKDAPLSSWQ